MRAFSSASSSSLIRSSKALIDGGAAGADIFAVRGRECGRARSAGSALLAEGDKTPRRRCVRARAGFSGVPYHLYEKVE